MWSFTGEFQYGVIQMAKGFQESMNLGRREADVSEEEVMEMFGMLQPDGSLSAEMRDGLDTFHGKDVENGRELSGARGSSSRSCAQSIRMRIS